MIGSTRLQQDKQILTDVKYNEGYFYFGTWGDDKNDSTYTENVYSCYSIGDIMYNKDKGKETEPVWTVEKNGGFYFADALFTGDYVLFGSDRDTTKSSSGKGAMIFSCMSGRKYRETQADDTVISAKPLEDDAKSAVVSDDTYPSIILVATKGKKLYKFKLSAGGELEKTEGKTEIDIDAQTTGAPAVYKGIMYMGLSNCTVEGVKISTMEKINAVSVPNYPQAGIYIEVCK